MESYDAMRQLVGGDAREMAKRIGRSSSLIQKWCEPSNDYSDSGAYNPLDRLEGMMDEAEKLNKHPREIYAPIRYLSQDRGVFIPLPQNSCSIEQICDQTARVIKEVGEALSAAGALLEQKNLTPIARKRALKEIDEALHELATLQGMFRHG
ncbi:MAG: hypothetical protein GQ578_09735 [Desulfuromonadaceae bacterium]|nr:hypothetical protein [Desulfuromonadaceae bacterium]